MKLYLVHCGFYDVEVCEGLYESHVNYYLVANDFDDAKVQAKALPEFQKKRMHIDGLQEIQAVGGYQVRLEHDAELNGQNRVLSFKHRELAPKSS